MHIGLVFNIQKYSLQDGPGIRTTVFMKGCSLDCWWCHNPESQLASPEVIVSENRCIECGHCRDACGSGGKGPCVRCGDCAKVCPTKARQLAGQYMSVSEVVAEVIKDRIFYEDSRGGATFSGGEPLSQPHFLIELLRACRNNSIHTALDTSGYGSQADMLAAAELSDLILYDIKLMDDARHMRYTGVSNARILENLEALSQAHSNIWLRLPIIPGINDTDADLDAAAKLAVRTRGIKQVSLLPYHKTGGAKFARMGRPYRLDCISSPSAQRMEQIAERFRRLGLNVTTGA